MMKKPEIVIGIDPDVSKSGVAQLRMAGREVELFSISFPELIDYLQRMADFQHRTGMTVTIVVEASWLISTNWHTKRADSVRTAARKGKDAGRCHEVGRKIVECARYYGLEVVEQLPLKKIWKGKDGKITHDELSAFVPGLPSRTNQEERDAMLLAWNHAGFPIRIKTLKTK